MAKYNSDIEDAIQDLETYIESAKPAPFSSNKIVLNRDELEYYIDELRKCIPEEVERYRKIISNKEAIERDAQAKADAMLNEVKDKTYELLSENEIMLQAKQKADEMIELAANEAQQIVDEATMASIEYKNQAQQYLNDMLVNLHELIYSCIDTTAKNSNKFLEALNQVGVTISDNLNELNGVSDEPEEKELVESEDVVNEEE